ncbi:MAG: alpha-glucan family phosphorylase [bacterium]
MKKNIRKFAVVPKLPERLLPLKEIANNVWWSWDHDAASLMLRIDRELWDKEDYNPLKVICNTPQARLEELSNDESFLNHMERVYNRLNVYLKSKSWFMNNYPNSIQNEDFNKTKDWFDTHSPESMQKVFAYFSAEFGLTETIPIYSGGLGILAGDHMKSTSDLGVPLCGVGLLYTEGYFRQYLNSDGWQQETYQKNDFFTMPIDLMRDKEGNARKISIEMPDGTLFARIWKVTVGRTVIYLLDSNLSENSPANREITSRLYGGDTEMRIKQEILLGIGGVKALYSLGKIPVVTHMNEGHSAFLALERIRILMEQHSLKFDEAKELVIASNVFTTHTPVPAGNDRFSVDNIKKYFSSYVPKLGISMDEFLKIGEELIDHNDSSKGSNFCMTVLALHLASYSNGVSKLHGKVSRNMWNWMWPDLELEDVPISSITNGVHGRTWISFDMASLLDRYLGPRWIDQPWDGSIWNRVKDIPSTELWHTHERRRERLVAFVRTKLKKQLEHKGATGAELEIANEVLDPSVLTIGFARRFATYKRATLLFEDIDRLTKLLGNKDMPVQIIFAGKAHPKDEDGKEFIKEIFRTAKKTELRRHIVFLEDYDMTIARYLVQGVDVWLNNPRRPLEASGTSGMKVCFNGGLNMSILDGWWDEAYNGDNGWAIGAGEEYDGDGKELAAYQDSVESKAIYQILEEQVIPKFYKRGTDGIPKEWVDMMKNSMMSNCPVYNTNRMVQEYTKRFYLNALDSYEKLSEDDFKGAKELSVWKKKIITSWDRVKIIDVKEPINKELQRDDALSIEAIVDLDKITPEDVTVSVFYGHLDYHGNIVNGKEEIMTVKGQDGSLYSYNGTIKCNNAGKFGYSVRIMADKEELVSRFHFGKIRWEPATK